ncbi:Uma2 family endonuclease [Saprospiraceae bacterium]|nr:Uma2 family endonuclease [Saprospiraceae bacterium]
MTEEKGTTEEPAADYDKIYTYADYLKFEYDHMVELIRGKIFKMTPAPTFWHQQISSELHISIGYFLKDKSCKIYAAPLDVILPVKNQKKSTSTTVVQPDLCIICEKNKIESAGYIGAPELIIEILSPSTSKKDLNDKYSIYEESGVKEYWVVFPSDKVIEVFYLEDENYERIKLYTHEDNISPILFPDLDIDLSEIFKNIPD